MSSKKIDVVEFEEDAIPLILDLLDKELDDECKIIDKHVKDVEVDQYSHVDLTKDNFGGVLVGSKIFVTKNRASFAEHLSIYCKQ